MISVFRKIHLATARPFCLSLLLFGLALHSPCEGQDLRDTKDSNSGKVDDLVQAVMKQEHVPGLALVVVKDGKILKAQANGLADVEKQIPATTNTVFRIASVSKQFVATAIMMLIEAGKLSLGDPISKYLPEAPRKKKKSWGHISTFDNIFKYFSPRPGRNCQRLRCDPTFSQPALLDVGKAAQLPNNYSPSVQILAPPKPDCNGLDLATDLWQTRRRCY